MRDVFTDIVGAVIFMNLAINVMLMCSKLNRKDN